MKKKISIKHKKSKIPPEISFQSLESDNLRASISLSGGSGVSVSIDDGIKNIVIVRSKSLSSFKKLDSSPSTCDLPNSRLKSTSDMTDEAVSIHSLKSLLTYPVQHQANETRFTDSGYSSTQTPIQTLTISTVHKPQIKTTSRAASSTSDDIDTTRRKISPHSQLKDPVEHQVNQVNQANQARSGYSDHSILQTEIQKLRMSTIDEPLIKSPCRLASCVSGDSDTTIGEISPHDSFSSTGDMTSPVQFLQNLASSDSPTLYQILKAIRNDQIKRFQELFGFPLDLLLYVAIELSLSNPTWSDKQLLSEFWRINNNRLFDTSFFLCLESQSSTVLGAENRISDILKLRTKDCLKCINCHDNIVSVLFLPCGHIVICGECSSSTSVSVCGICGIDIEEVHNVFF